MGTAFAGIAIVAAACTSSGGGAGVYGDGATTVPAASPAASAAAASTAPSAAAGGGKYATGNEDDYGTPASKPPASAGTAGAASIGLGNGAVGAFLTGADGMTLYIFKKDSAGKSACEGGCATNWPPLVADGGAVPTAGDGVTGALTTFPAPTARCRSPTRVRRSTTTPATRPRATRTARASGELVRRGAVG